MKSNSARETTNTTTGAGWPLEMRGDQAPAAQMAATTGTDLATYTRERPGMSAFVLEEERRVSHLFHLRARLDGLWGMYQWLDRAPKGRNETGIWWHRHDEYDKP